jgi:hypothetical protein
VAKGSHDFKYIKLGIRLLFAKPLTLRAINLGTTRFICDCLK